MKAKLVYLGIKGTVVAVDSTTGQQVWAAALKGGDFVNLLLADDHLYASTRGEVFCLDPNTGTVRWHNPLKGYGWGLVSLVCEGGNSISQPPILAEKRRREQQAAASSATVVH